jgi:hypothetical protein
MLAMPVSQANAQTAIAPQKVACVPDTTPLSNGDAEHVELGSVRSLLHDGKVADAETMATAFSASHPNSSFAETMMTTVLIREGDVPGAYAHGMKAVSLNPCNGYAHAALAKVLAVSAMDFSAEQQLEAAHQLLPQDNSINISLDRLKSKTISSCKVVNAPSQGKLPLEPIRQPYGRDAVGLGATEIQGQPYEPDYPIYDFGLDVLLNGKRRRLLVSTATTGLTLSQAAAAQFDAAGGQNNTVNTVQISDVRVGDFAFKDCTVKVLPTADLPRDIEGKIGLELLGNYAFSLNFAVRELHYKALSPLPEDVAFHDRYVPAEMKDWSKLYRAGTQWLLPTSIDNGPTKLFALATENPFTTVDAGAASAVTKVEPLGTRYYVDKQGNRHPVMDASVMVLNFAGVRQDARLTHASDLGAQSTYAGIAISGELGLQSYVNQTLSLDLRDGLMKISAR